MLVEAGKMEALDRKSRIDFYGGRARGQVEIRDVAMSYVAKSEEEIRRLAVDIVSGQVFTSAHIRGNDVENLLRLIFMPLVFMTDDDIEVMKKNHIHVLYEYYSKAGPRSINGYPIFMSFHVLDEADAAKVWTMMKKFEAKTLNFLGGSSGQEIIDDPNQTSLFGTTDEK